MKNKKNILIIAKHQINPGEHISLTLPAPQLYTSTPADIPIHIINAKKPGPKLFICATIHGDEITGVEIIRRLLKLRIVQHLSAGTLIAVPVVNIYGFIDQSRYLPDRRDLNRNFPGKKKGSLASRLAYLFLHEIVKKCTHGIDLHTGASHRFNIPQIRANLAQPGVKQLAKSFGAPVILDSSLRDGSLRAATHRMHMPLLVYEGGEALRFDEVSIHAGMQGIIRVMKSLKMIRAHNHADNPRSIKKHASLISHTSIWARAPCSGMIQPLKLLGKKIVKGEVIAMIADPFGHQETPVIAPASGIIVGYSTIPLAHEGDALFHIASFKKIKHLRSKLKQLKEWYP